MTKKQNTSKKKSMMDVAKSAPVPILKVPIEDGKFEETQQRIVHRYYLMLEQLGISKEELKGASPIDTQTVICGIIEEYKQTPTEEEVLFQTGKKIKLGEKIYDIPLLKIKESLKWREQCGIFSKNMFDYIIQTAKKPSSESDGPRYPALDIFSKTHGIDVHALVNAGMPYVMGVGFEEFLDLVFLYSKELKEDEELIRETADIGQLSHAAMEVFKIALPFVANIFQGMWISFQHVKASGMRIG